MPGKSTGTRLFLERSTLLLRVQSGHQTGGKRNYYAHTLFSGNETKPRDIIGKVGTFIKTEGEGVDPTITPEPLPMF